MRPISSKKITETIEQLCVEAAFELPEDVTDAIKKAAESESNASAKKILNQLIENAEIAKNENLPLCQDTGLTIVFVEQGAETIIEGSINDAINTGVKQAYEKAYLRKSVVAEPLNKRKNTNSNTPAIIHHSIVPGEKLKLSVMLKGGGCENKSKFKMFKPTADKQQIIDWIITVVKDAGADACPPFILGIGIGGDFELSAIISKKALLRKIGEKNPDKFYAEMENEILTKTNTLNIGPQGLTGDTTALACAIETAPCHIASLPVAVNIECHSHRHKTKTI